MLSSRLLAAFNRRRSPSVQSRLCGVTSLCDVGGRQTARVSNISICTPAWANVATSAAVAWPWLDAKAAPRHRPACCT
jgi:hypothetical protein